MLIEKFSLFELLKDGFSILKKQTKNYEVLLYFVVIPSLISYLFIFFDIYKNIGPKENSELIVLQASIVASIIKGIPFINIFWIGFGAGFTLNMLNLPVLTFGIGIYLPFYLTLPVFIGGLLNSMAKKISEKFSSDALLFANGLMSGEAITGVILSIIAYVKLFI